MLAIRGCTYYEAATSYKLYSYEAIQVLASAKLAADAQEDAQASWLPGELENMMAPGFDALRAKAKHFGFTFVKQFQFT